MRLTNPWTGLPVDAPEDAAKRLIERGFVPEETPKPKRKAPAKRTPRKPKTTE